jgi:hypothetical protein
MRTVYSTGDFKLQLSKRISAIITETSLANVGLKPEQVQQMLKIRKKKKKKKMAYILILIYRNSYVGRIERNEQSKFTKNAVTSVRGPLAASSLSNMNAKSAHAHLSRSRHAQRENGCQRHVVSSTFCHWISCQRG